MVEMENDISTNLFQNLQVGDPTVCFYFVCFQKFVTESVINKFCWMSRTVDIRCISDLNGKIYAENTFSKVWQKLFTVDLS